MLAQVETSILLVLLHRTRIQLSYCHLKGGRLHSHKQESMTCDCGHRLALSQAPLMILVGLHAFYPEKEKGYSPQPGVLEQENTTLIYDGYENRMGDEVEVIANEIMSESESVHGEIDDLHNSTTLHSWRFSGAYLQVFSWTLKQQPPRFPFQQISVYSYAAEPQLLHKGQQTPQTQIHGVHASSSLLEYKHP